MERDIRHTWIFANLKNTLLSSRRICEKILTSIQLLSNLKAQSKARKSSPSNLKKLADFEKQCRQLFDICACKCKFLFDATVEEENIPCTDYWRTKVICSCQISARIHPRKLEFLLDQRSERRMSIEGVDVAVSQDNMKRFHRNSSQKRAGVKVAPIENIDNLITSSENESSSQSPKEFEQSCETEEECAGPSHLVSSDVYKLTDKKFVCLRSTSSILQDATDPFPASSSFCLQ